MAPYQCVYCDEDLEEGADNFIRLLPGDNTTTICIECATTTIAEQFRTAIKSEQVDAPSWGTFYIPVVQLEGILGTDFVQRYNMELEERKTLLKRRRYCRMVDAQTGQECGGFIGKVRRGPPGEPKKTLCRICWTEACRICAAPLITATRSLLEHRCDLIPPQVKVQVVPIDGEVQGVHFQYCPHSQCGQVFYLNDGCNAVTCRQRTCGTQFCIVCGKKALHDSNHWHRRPGGCPRYSNRETGGGGFDPDHAYTMEDKEQPETYELWPVPHRRDVGPCLHIYPPACKHELDPSSTCSKCGKTLNPSCAHEVLYNEICVECGLDHTETREGFHRFRARAGWIARQLSDYMRRRFIGVNSFIRLCETSQAILEFEYIYENGPATRMTNVTLTSWVMDLHMGRDERAATEVLVADVMLVLRTNHDWFSSFLENLFSSLGYHGTGELSLWDCDVHERANADAARHVKKDTNPPIQIFPDSSWPGRTWSIEISWKLFVQHIKHFYLGHNPNLKEWLSWIEDIPGFSPGDLETKDLYNGDQIRLDLPFSTNDKRPRVILASNIGELRSGHSAPAYAANVALCNRILPMFYMNASRFARFVNTLCSHHMHRMIAVPRPFFIKDVVVRDLFVLKAPTEGSKHYELGLGLQTLYEACNYVESIYPDVYILDKFEHIFKKKRDGFKGDAWEGDAVHVRLDFGQDETCTDGTSCNGLVTAVREAWYSRDDTTQHEPPPSPEISMVPVTARYKNQAGTLSISTDKRNILWISDPENTGFVPGGSTIMRSFDTADPVSIPIGTLEDIQQPGAGAPSQKIALRFPTSKHNYVFHFTHKHEAEQEFLNFRQAVVYLLARENQRKQGGYLAKEETWLKDFMQRAVVDGSSAKFWDAVFQKLRAMISTTRLPYNRQIGGEPEQEPGLRDHDGDVAME